MRAGSRLLPFTISLIPLSVLEPCYSVNTPIPYILQREQTIIRNLLLVLQVSLT